MTDPFISNHNIKRIRNPEERQRAYKKFKEKHPLYRKERNQKYPWERFYSMSKKRCLNPNEIGFKNYGGRGIKFLLSMEEVKFLWFRDKAWLLKQPSIDRLDDNGNYELSNCRFIEKTLNISLGHLGEKNHFCKLTTKEVLKIRKLFSQGFKQIKLAQMFKTTDRNISLIVNHQSWVHI